MVTHQSGFISLENRKPMTPPAHSPSQPAGNRGTAPQLPYGDRADRGGLGWASGALPWAGNSPPCSLKAERANMLTSPGPLLGPHQGLGLHPNSPTPQTPALEIPSCAWNLLCSLTLQGMTLPPGPAPCKAGVPPSQAGVATAPLMILGLWTQAREETGGCNRWLAGQWVHVPHVQQ